MTEDEMVGWHYRLDGHGFGWTPGVDDGQGGLACCDSWVAESNVTIETEQQKLNSDDLAFSVQYSCLVGIVLVISSYFWLRLKREVELYLNKLLTCF